MSKAVRCLIPPLLAGLAFWLPCSVSVGEPIASGPSQDGGLRELIRALKDADYWARRDAAEAIGALGPQALPAADALIALIRTEHVSGSWNARDGWHVASAASEALGAMGPAVIPRLLAALPGKYPDEDEGVEDIVSALSQIGAPAVAPLVAIVESNKEPADRRADAVNAIQGMAVSDAVAAIPALRHALQSDDRRLALCATMALYRMDSQAAPAVPELRALLEGSDALLRAEAASTLGRIGPAASAAVPRLGELLEDPDGQVQLKSALALAQMGSAVSVIFPQLLSTLNRPWPNMVAGAPHPGLQASVAECLGNIGPPARQAIGALEKALWQGCGAAAPAIAKIDPERAAPILLRALQTSQADTVHAFPLQIIDGLGMCGRHATVAVELLTQVATNGAGLQLREAANNALQRVQNARQAR